jgi:hypothetical protein
VTVNIILALRVSSSAPGDTETGEGGQEFGFEVHMWIIL